MKVYTIDRNVMLGSGGVPLSSYTTLGISGTDEMLDPSVPIGNPGDGGNAEASEPIPSYLGAAPSAEAMPNAGGVVADVLGAGVPMQAGPSTTTSQYSTQGPIPKG